MLFDSTVIPQFLVRLPAYYMLGFLASLSLAFGPRPSLYLSEGRQAMGRNPNSPEVTSTNPTTKIGPKMDGEFTYQPTWDPKTVLTTTAI